MGFPSDNLPMSFNAEKLEKLLRHAKVTQQSIQAVSSWILDRRAYLHEIVEIWVRLLRENEPSHQIVYLYIANETMQVGVRKYGKHIAELFEVKLLEVVQYVMTEGDEKVKRCILKIIGIWKERHTVNIPLLEMLQNVCAGKPTFVEGAVEVPVSEDEQIRTAQEVLMQEIDSEEGEKVALGYMTEVTESVATAMVNQHLQELVSATISADLLSDRMFQLESSLSAFHHAIEAFNNAELAAEAKGGTRDDADQQEKSAGDIMWEMLDQQVFGVDVERSREHVQQYRANLETQNAKRDELLLHLESLKTYDPFQEPMFHTSKLLRDQQTESLERLFTVCLKAEILDKQREAERQAMHKHRPPLVPTSSADASYRRSPPRTEYYRSSDPVAESPSSFHHHHHQQQQQHPRSPVHRRYSNSMDSRDLRRDGGYDQFGRDDGYSKRPRLTHSQSMDDARQARPSRWDQSPRGVVPNDTRGNDFGDGTHDHQYQDYRGPSPRHSHDNNNSSRPSPREDGRREEYQRRW